MGDGITKDALRDPLLEGFDDGGRRGEVHVRDPIGIEVRAAVPLQRARAAARMNGVEIEHGLKLKCRVLLEHVAGDNVFCCATRALD